MPADVAPDAAADAVLPHPVHLRHTLGPLGRGDHDPSIRIGAGQAWRATRTPAGPATLHLRLAEDGRSLTARAWGPGAGWAVAHASTLCGAGDDWSGFPDAHPVVSRLRRRMPRLRLCRSDAVVEALLRAVLEQKVTGREASRSYRRLVTGYGEPAPGPAAGRLWVPPSAQMVAAIPLSALHRLGVEHKRAQTLRLACSAASRLEGTADLGREAASRRLLALPGIGPWTTAEVMRVALGDPDAVSVGDYHLPDQVAWVLAGEPRAGDERMLELLEPYRGHRARVTCLIEAAGTLAPRFGPRLAPRRLSDR